MKRIAIIPARYGSTRLPGKPLLDETGKPLIRHVVEQVRQADRLDDIVVATDDERIVSAVEGFGGKAVMTSTECRTGTDRLAEAARKLDLTADDVVVNVQGDEPDIPPSCIDRLINLLETDTAPMATLATRLLPNSAADPNRVKVVFDRNGLALYFSRAKIPHDRDATGEVDYYLHLGIYAYRVGFLEEFAAMENTPAESAEKLEQLRALENGYRIAVAPVSYDGNGIDTREDYAAFVERFGTE
ncbi:MAG: 3-deoxy-manno-octulosonate cytidylyltransferase [Phycisphaerae bacterium]